MRSRKATIDDYVNAVRANDCPVAMKQDIADIVGVTRQTVQNHSDELANDSRLKSGKVGQATVYWLSEDEHLDEEEFEALADEIVHNMNSCEPYTIKDLLIMKTNTDRWVLMRILNQLYNRGKVDRKNHATGTITYWRS